MLFVFIAQSVYTKRIMSFLDKFFGPSYEKELASLAPLVVQINSLELELEPLAVDV